MHKDRLFRKKLLENKEMVLKKWVKNIQIAAYNGAYGKFLEKNKHFIFIELNSY